ncbi:hypothetical protein ABBQ32_012988 [Trebouxia sp. C0010 RCD-2024]
MRHAAQAWRQVAYLAPKACRMSSRSESPRISAAQRGAFILFEGGDRCGKTTQSQSLVDHLQASGVKAELWKFPDRQTGTGCMIDSYLTSKTELDDAAVHLLFCANRWEKREAMLAALKSGTTLVVDRYSYSGVVFTSAKQMPGLDLSWCKAPETGLPAPDLVLYLRLPHVETAAQRGGYGEERYENTAFQQEVQHRFDGLQDSSWTVLDASRSIEDLQTEVQAAATTAISRCQTGAPLRQLWRAASPPLNSIDNTYT